MADVVLSTLNAKYAHASFGLRYLRANVGELFDRTEIVEFDISQRPTDVLEGILKRGPRVVGLGVYIWNAVQSTQLAGELKRVRPDVVLVVGGPEVSYETDQQEIARVADYVIAGEADVAFGELCARVLSGRRPLNKVIRADLPEFETKEGSDPVRGKGLELPYSLYTDEDIRNRVIYVEASRGCPFKCEFCLSSLDVPVRNVPTEAFLAEMGKLLDRGCRQFKFVDRTFNLNLNISRAILQFFLDRYVPGLFLHFEMIPDRLPEGLRELIRQFPPGALQFEVGIQTFNDDVAHLISRRQDNAKVEENFRFLREQTGVHVHADLIAGLPGEDLESFGRGFDRLVAMRPQEIQVGILKRLRGTPIVRHDAEWGMVWSPAPPYEILSTKLVDFGTMQRVRRFARYWDLIANSGNFVETTPLAWRGGSAFESFMALSDWIYAKTGQTHAIALQNLAGLIFEFVTTVRGVDAGEVARHLWNDYQRAGRSDRPAFLKPYIPDSEVPARREALTRASKRRQDRHLAQGTEPSGSAAGLSEN